MFSILCSVGPEQYGFELHRFTYTQIFFNKYCKCIFLFLMVLHFLKILFICLDRGEGREVGRERNTDVREKHQSVASCMLPNRGPGPQPRHVP